MHQTVRPEVEESSNVRNVEDLPPQRDPAWWRDLHGVYTEKFPQRFFSGRDDHLIQKYFYTNLLCRFHCINNPNIEFLPTVFIEDPTLKDDKNIAGLFFIHELLNRSTCN